MFDQSSQQVVDLSLIANIEAREGRTVRGDADGQKAAVVTEGKNVLVSDVIADINRSGTADFSERSFEGDALTWRSAGDNVDDLLAAKDSRAGQAQTQPP